MVDQSKSQHWWQTVPGMLTAVAAMITAVTGLIIALQQTGVFKEKPALEPSSAAQSVALPMAAKSASEPENFPTSPKHSASDQAIQMPDGETVTIRSPTGDSFRYNIVSAQTKPFPPDSTLLQLHIRAWTDSPGGMNFWSDSFRLSAGEAILKPVNPLNELVARDETREADIEFVLDRPLREATLVITVGGLNFSGNSRQLRLLWP